MSEFLVVWSGTLHRQDEANYSLLGDGWRVKSNLTDHAPGKRDYIAPKDFQGKGGVQPADTSWRMAVISAPKAKRPSPKEAREARLERHRQKRTAA